MPPSHHVMPNNNREIKANYVHIERGKTDLFSKYDISHLCQLKEKVFFLEKIDNLQNYKWRTKVNFAKNACESHRKSCRWNMSLRGKTCENSVKYIFF